MNPIDHSSPGWGYVLGQNVLEAAQSCGWECARVFVTDGQVPEAPPPGGAACCQLAVSVETGWSQPRNSDDLYCLPVYTADVTVYLDLCVLVADSQSVLKPVDINARALENQQALWMVMQGLLTLRTDSLMICGYWGVGGWEPMGQSGGNARWQTRWSYRQ